MKFEKFSAVSDLTIVGPPMSLTEASRLPTIPIKSHSRLAIPENGVIVPLPLKITLATAYPKSEKYHSLERIFGVPFYVDYTPAFAKS